MGVILTTYKSWDDPPGGIYIYITLVWKKQPPLQGEVDWDPFAESASGKLFDEHNGPRSLWQARFLQRLLPNTCLVEKTLFCFFGGVVVFFFFGGGGWGGCWRLLGSCVRLFFPEMSHIWSFLMHPQSYKHPNWSFFLNKPFEVQSPNKVWTLKVSWMIHFSGLSS